jgi:predicted anti-sigma-YlaC factor YlaD
MLYFRICGLSWMPTRCYGRFACPMRIMGCVCFEQTLSQPVVVSSVVSLQLHGRCLYSSRVMAPRLLWLLLLFMLPACSPQSLLVKGVADELAGQAQADEDDLMLARDASAFYLKLSESVLKKNPGHGPLAVAVASGFTQYAYAFVAFEADRIETSDVKAAQRLRSRAAQLYWRGQRHAMAALETQQPGFAKALAAGQARLQPDQVALAYWAAASWGAAISLSKDRPDAVADFPLALRLGQLAWQLEPSHCAGDLSALMGNFEAARPGGSAASAQRYFALAQQQGQGRNAGVLVAQAEAVAAQGGDRATFERLLREALAAADGRKDLANAVMRERALWLLQTADDRF